MPHIGRDPPCGGPQLLTSLLHFVFEQCTFAEALFKIEIFGFKIKFNQVSLALRF